MLADVFKRRFAPPLKLWEHYNRACQDCEIIVDNIPEDQIPVLASSLVADKRTEGNRGQVLADSLQISGILLRKGDRLEPSCHLWDWARLQEVAPKTLTFRCAFLSPTLGTCLEDICAVDAMHTVVLGVMSQLVLHVCWSLLSGNPWQIDFQFTAQEVRHANNMAKMAALWKTFYSGWNRQGHHSEHSLSDIGDWRVDKLGTKTEPKLYLKAGQTLSFMRFLQSEMRTWPGEYEGKAQLVDAVELLMKWYCYMEDRGLIIPAAEIEDPVIGMVAKKFCVFFV